jgi:hypothetical protein
MPSAASESRGEDYAVTARSKLAWPTGWTVESRRRDRPVLMAVLSFCCGAVLALAGVAAARDGDRPGVAFFVLGSWIFMCTSVGLLLAGGRRRRRQAIHSEWVEAIGQDAVVLPCARTPGIAAPVVAIAFLPFTAVATVAYGTAAMESHGRDWSSLIVSSISTLVFLAMLALLVLTLPAIWTRVREFVAVGTTGIHQRGPTWSTFFPWDEILALDAIELNGPFVSIRRLDTEKLYVRDTRRFKLGRPSSSSMANRGIATTSLAVDPALVYYGIRFYHENPQLRAELAYDAGAERFRRADFT